MSLLSNVFTLTGYTLVYAAVVGGSVPAYAKDPWLGLMVDAYTVDPSTGVGSTTKPYIPPPSVPISGAGQSPAQQGAGGQTGTTGPSRRRGTTSGGSSTYQPAPPAGHSVGPTGPVQGNPNPNTAPSPATAAKGAASIAGGATAAMKAKLAAIIARAKAELAKTPNTPANQAVRKALQQIIANKGQGTTSS